jgi:hypothetical protein
MALSLAFFTFAASSTAQAAIMFHDNASPRRVCASTSNSETVSAGDAVTTRLRIGSYTIEREGRALQAAKPGARFFIRTSDGVLAVYNCGGEQ